MADDYSEFTPVTNAGKPVMAPRFNNPGNIKDMKTGQFRTFATPEEGHAAMEQDLTAKGNKGYNTVSKIINRYAPPSDNNPTQAYINNVSKALGVGPNDKLDMTDPKVIAVMKNAMVAQEGNRNVQPTTVAPVTPADPYAEFHQFTPVAAPPANVGYSDNMPGLSTARATTEGIVRGATAGLSDYVPAAMAYGVGKLRGDNYSFAETLKAVRARNADVAAQHPTATAVGNVGGAVGTAIATGGTSIPVNMAIQGAMGATQAYTSSPEATATDALKAGTLQGGVAGLLGGVGKGLTYGAGALKDYVMNNMTKAVMAKGAPLTAAESQSIYNDALKQYGVWESIKAGTKSGGKEVLSGIVPAIAGGAAGAAAAPFTGMDPLKGAMIGAAGSIGASKAAALGKLTQGTANATGRVLINNPAIERAIPTITAAGTPLIMATQPKAQTVDDYSEFTPYTP
jgi:hypothetical protein